MFTPLIFLQCDIICLIAKHIITIFLFTFSDVEALAALLKRFLGLEELQRRLAEEVYPDDDDIEDLGLGDSSDSKDED